MDTASPRLRMSLLGVVVIGCFAALFARLWYLQVIEAPQLTVVATQNRTREIAVEAPRGRILDAKGHVLVDNRTSLVVTIDRNELRKVADRDAVVSNLAGLLTQYSTPTKVDSIERRLADLQYDDLQPVPIAVDVTPELMIYLAEHGEDYPSVSVEPEWVRTYNYPGVAGNVLGYVGRISAKALETAQPGVDPDTGTIKTYQPDSNIGLAGIEATYEDDLRGTPGIETIEIDSKNRPVRTQSVQPPKPGDDVQLNIDIDTQIRAEDSLRGQLDAIRGTKQNDGKFVRKAQAGSAVVLDPNNGAVIALATYPSYDPSDFVNGISQARYDQLKNTEGVNALIDRSITGQYEPGSTFKLVTATAAVNNGIITGSTPYNDTGKFELGDRAEDVKRNSGGAVNGYISLPRAITVSSDTFFYNLGARMDETPDIQNTAAAYGFDAPTGIDLPNEESGYVYTKEEKEALHDKYPKAYPNDTTWYTGDNVNLAIGQAMVAVTPLQLARAYGTFSNGGTVYEPHVAARVMHSGAAERPLTDPDQTGVLRTIEPVVKSQVDLPPSTWDPIHQGLAGVTTDKNGTAFGAFLGFDQRAFPIVGKTGTAQVDGKADTSVFASYGPDGGTRYAVAAILEESGFGSQAAAPVVRHLYEFLAGQEATDFGVIVGGKVD